MKKYTIIFVFFSFVYITVFAQNNLFKWPISNKKIGENILYRPNDYIDNEINNSDLILFADESTFVFSPISGHIESCHYVYKKNYSSAIWFGVQPSLDYMADCYEILKSNSGANYDPKYIHVTIGIKTLDGKQLYIQGLRPAKIFKTGEKIFQGDTIGKAGYLYFKINQPAIALSVSKNGRAEDPMLPFGLKSTFKKFSQKKVDFLTKEEALEDINLLKEAIEEGYPGLYDYITSGEWEETILNLKKKIPEKISYHDFYLLTHSFVNRIRDDHFTMITRLPMNQDKAYSSTITFGFLNDSLIITNTKLTHKEYYGRNILEVNGIAIDSIKQLLVNEITSTDGYVQSDIDFNLFAWGWIFFDNVTNNPKHEYLVKFKNDTTVFFSSVSTDKSKRFCTPYKANWRNFFHHNTDSLTLLKIGDSIGYMGIHSFFLTEIEIDKIAAFIQDPSCRHLIIDVRNNSGGDERIVAQLFSFFANQPFVMQEYSQVKKRNNFNFFRYCTNYNEEVSDLFMEYEAIHSKDGYFYLNRDTIYPHQNIKFDERLYVITNERSKSASSILAGLVHKYKRGAIIGRETGSTYHQMNALKFAQLLLPNSQIEITIPLVKIVFDTNNSIIPYGRGAFPHYPINFSLKELEFLSDTMLNYALQLISERRYIDEDLLDFTPKPISILRTLVYIGIGLGISMLCVLLFKRKKNGKRNSARECFA